MTRKAGTKDERFIVVMYQLAAQAGDEETEIDPYVVGREIGQNDKGIATIVKHLAQANFLKRGHEEPRWSLTPQGVRLAKSLLY